jgi:hypothetical protein
MHDEKDQFSSGYPDPSFALDQLTDCPEDCSRATSSLAPDRVIESIKHAFYSADYPDPSLGLLPAEQEEMEEEEVCV